jgi:hypothetical protein
MSRIAPKLQRDETKRKSKNDLQTPEPELGAEVLPSITMLAPNDE